MRQPIVAFVSQKGGTGKSTLARALGAVIAHAGLKVKIADLDPEQETVLYWEKLRDASRTEPPITVEGFETAAEAIESAEDDELLIIDAPAHANRGTLEICQAATLIVQPTGASIDDLRPAVLLFHELVQAGIPKERLVMALCRILSQGEEDRARAYVKAGGYDVLPGCIPERTRLPRSPQPRAGRDGSQEVAQRARGHADGRTPCACRTATERAQKTSCAQAKGCVMSRDDEVSKTLGGWLGKAKKIGQPPQPSEAKETLNRPETVRGSGSGDAADAAQLQDRPRTKKRIKQLAVRDNITLLVMLDRMLALYEREYGKLGK